ncbi:glutathione S-transferase family protein [Sneathiella chinensis]|uniref:Glutathione S-transferase n=1 Tax=Sneathiella chinensis TaxID=349750 RepID=A0ABQ5U967_9PROT|nr:glutathione S-transferase N-terminal domain-containing protein [Sneathiella chinensis]GLQ07857.1 glutathione S-transferase [Sneathiella chinensis]
MKLCHSPTSPFVRKVMVTAHELGLVDRLDLVKPDISDIFKGINPENPLGKIPSLQLEDGSLIFDSIVICEYLDSLSDTATLFPADPLDRARVMTLHAIANGMTDAAYQRRMDSSAMPKGEGSPTWNARLQVAMERSLDELENKIDTFKGRLDIGTIAIGCALGYHDLRFSAENWREGRPELTAWYNEFSARPSMQATQPPAS